MRQVLGATEGLGSQSFLEGESEQEWGDGEHTLPTSLWFGAFFTSVQPGVLYCDPDLTCPIMEVEGRSWLPHSLQANFDSSPL